MGFAIARIIAIIFLVLALGRYPYGYYTLIKLVVCGVTVYGACFAKKMEKIGWVWSFGIIAVLFNPVIPVHLYSRSTWQFIDLAVAVVLLISIFAVRKSQSLKQTVDTFNKQSRVIRVVLYADLKDEYSHEYDTETASFLAGQVVNYLFGEDLKEIYANTSDSNKAVIDRIKRKTPIRAHHLLKANKSVRELIVYTLRMKAVLKFGLSGEEYLENPEKARIENILKKYGAEYPEEVSPKLYSQIVNRFLKLPHKVKQ